MKVMTQFGLLNINLADVVSIRPAPVIPETIEFNDLTYCVEFDDRFYSMGDLVVCISEDDAEKLSELSGIEIEGRRRREYMESSKTIFVPFRELLALDEWEATFDNLVKKGLSPV
jgi:hypothetical protein